MSIWIWIGFGNRPSTPSSPVNPPILLKTSAGPRPIPSSAEVRRLGAVFLLAALILFSLAAWKAHGAGSGPDAAAGGAPDTAFWPQPGFWQAAAAALFAGLGLACLALGTRAASIHRGWMALGEALGRVVSPVVLALLYFLVVTPFGLASRLRRRDPLGLRPDPRAPTYWREPVSKRTDRQGLLRQY